MRRNIVLIPAAGVGIRFGAVKPKQYCLINGSAIILHTLNRFLIKEIDLVCLVLSREDTNFNQLGLANYQLISSAQQQVSGLKKPLVIAYVGGPTRAESVNNGLNYLLEHQFLSAEDWVLVHDAVRCCLSKQYLKKLIATVRQTQDGGLLAVKVTDTVKQSRQGNRVEKTVARQDLWLAQTPQMFLAKNLQTAFKQIELKNLTDESSYIEAIGLNPILVEADIRNIKITTAQDVNYASYLLTTTLE